jgi:homocysteine S-methyltransferase
VGTHLQTLGVPIGWESWAGAANLTHPDTVRFMHEQYIGAGADVITTNTYSSARHCFEPMGLGDMTRELNLRAVVLAQEARDRAAKGRVVHIGGAISNYGAVIGSEGRRRAATSSGSEYSEGQIRANLREQAEILAESGVDFLIAESTGSIVHRTWVSEACKATGLPFWAGFKTRMEDGKVKSGYRENEDFNVCLDRVLPYGGSAISIFHSSLDATDASIPMARKKYKGPIAVYPDGERHDYVARRADANEKNPHDVAAFVKRAQGWVNAGAQIVGGCCGYGFEYIAPLRDALPKRITAKAA